MRCTVTGPSSSEGDHSKGEGQGPLGFAVRPARLDAGQAWGVGRVSVNADAELCEAFRPFDVVGWWRGFICVSDFVFGIKISVLVYDGWLEVLALPFS